MKIGVDIGGHTLSSALVSSDHRILQKIELETPPSRKLEEVLNCISAMVGELSKGHECSGIGLGVPGMIDVRREKVYKLPNFPGWEGSGLKKVFEKVLPFPLVIENDGNCYALGEGVAGKALGKTDYAVLTLGTGIGGGIVCGGRLLRGSHGMAGELGHIATADSGKCGCGAIGHIETLSAADGIERMARREGLPANVEILWKKRYEKEIWPIWDRALDTLGRAIASLIHILDTEMIILGGGMSRAQGLLEELEPYIIRYTAPAFYPHMDIRISELGNNAALIGAACLPEP